MSDKKVKSEKKAKAPSKKSAAKAAVAGPAKLASGQVWEKDGFSVELVEPSASVWVVRFSGSERVVGRPEAELRMGVLSGAKLRSR